VKPFCVGNRQHASCLLIVYIMTTQKNYVEVFFFKNDCLFEIGTLFKPQSPEV